MNKPSTWGLVVLSTVFAASLFAQAASHVISPVNEAKWGPAPPMVPRGRSSRSLR